MNKELTLRAFKKVREQNDFLKEINIPKEFRYDDELDIIETSLKDYAEIKKMCRQYNIEFNLVNIRHALFTLAQLKGRSGTNWGNFNIKLEALEIITKKRVDVGYLMSCDFLCDYNDCDETPYDKPLTQEEFDLLKEGIIL